MEWIVVTIAVVSGLSMVYRGALVFLSTFRDLGGGQLALITARQGHVQSAVSPADRPIRQSLWPNRYAGAQPVLKPFVVLLNSVLTVVAVFAAFLNVYAIIAEQLDNGFDLFAQWRAMLAIAVAAAVLYFEDSRDGVLMLRMAAVVLANILGITYLLVAVSG